MAYEKTAQLAEIFQIVTAKWKKLPKGWSDKTMKNVSKKVMKNKEHPFTDCVEKFKDKGMKSPEGFCASLKDEYKGTTKWRGKEKKK